MARKNGGAGEGSNRTGKRKYAREKGRKMIIGPVSAVWAREAGMKECRYSSKKGGSEKNGFCRRSTWGHKAYGLTLGKNGMVTAPRILTRLDLGEKARVG